MLNFDDTEEDKMATFEDLLAGTETQFREHLAILGSNAGHAVLAVSMPALEAAETTTVYNDPENSDEAAQRELNEAHANGLASYTLHAAAVAGIAECERLGRPVLQEWRNVLALMGPQEVFALAPWTANLRGVDRNDPNSIRHELVAKVNGVNVVRVWLRSSVSWSLLDGQHRKAGFDRARAFLDFVASAGTYPSGKGRRSFFGLKGEVPKSMRQFWVYTREALARMTVTIDLHIGLNVAEERQTFADLNNKTRKVATDLSYQFDRANAIVVFIQDDLSDLIGAEEDGALSLTELASVNAIAFQNKTNVRGAVPTLVAERKATVKSMWEAIKEVDGFGDAESSVISQIVVQKAIAKLVYDLGFSRSAAPEDAEHLQTLLNNLNDVNFSHDNPMWRYYTLSDDQRKPGAKQINAIKGIEPYLPKDENGNVTDRDIGTFQNSRFTFSVKHNDVYPIIADMIRYKLGLPTRHA
ncbi:DNA sulfur modification protein DndB [Mesorhizobium sp. B263B2A]|uniref:DNA sulfur modification protein DndB n=1 Tax=Mesorhizobium sp. B263B2A TaxID=2876669 RepID=UPI001CD093D8|nr:DNA sulfur modification protein DndB [Mesorhizobium sp. B263B2A]MCA0029251.1 DNA sulfur modification protein DndB [Mesorhizobium sp. B263B2A]